MDEKDADKAVEDFVLDVYKLVREKVNTKNGTVLEVKESVAEAVTWLTIVSVYWPEVIPLVETLTSSALILKERTSNVTVKGSGYVH